MPAAVAHPPVRLPGHHPLSLNYVSGSDCGFVKKKRKLKPPKTSIWSYLKDAKEYETNAMEKDWRVLVDHRLNMSLQSNAKVLKRDMIAVFIDLKGWYKRHR